MCTVRFAGLLVQSCRNFTNVNNEMRILATFTLPMSFGNRYGGRRKHRNTLKLLSGYTSANNICYAVFR